MILLVDIGNSRLKWAIADAGVIRHTEFVDYRAADFIELLRTIWSGIDRPRQLAIATVAGQQVAEAIVQLANQLWPATEIIVPLAEAQAFGVISAYCRPEKLGVDRWLALLAAHRYYPGCSCIVDCGTAITIDIIEADGRHLGGLISPGLLLMKKALAQNTAALPFSETQSATSLANATEAAIDNGTLLAAVGMVEAVLRRQSKPYRLILSGGDAERVAGQLAVPAIVDSQLVFKGLLNYCRNENAS